MTCSPYFLNEFHLVSLIYWSINKNDAAHLRSQNTAKRYFKIPFIQGLSERVSQILRDEIVEFAFKAAYTIRGSYFKLKSRTALNSKSSIIYNVLCWLSTKNIHNPNRMKNIIALAGHFFNELHWFNIDSVNIWIPKFFEE